MERTLGVLSPLLGGSYFGRMIAGIQLATRAAGARLIAIPTADAQVEYALPQLAAPLAWQQVDGWICVLNAVDDAYLARLAELGRPIVSISQLRPALASQTVLPDNRGGIAAAVGHLVEHGHRRIGFVGFLEQTDIIQRFEGYQAALAAHGIAYDPQWLLPAYDHMQAAGAQAARRMLDLELGCTALVCATDTNALGAIKALQAAGCAVPEMVAVTGFDDIEQARHARPALTTLRQQFDALGETAARIVLERLAGQEHPAGPVYVANALVVRQSCGCAAPPAEPPLPYELRKSLEHAIEDNTRISLTLLRTHPEHSHDLDWLQWTPVQWACLGLWEGGDQRRLAISRSFSARQEPLPASGSSYAAAEFPPLAIMPASTAGGGPDIVTLHPIRTAGREWGVLALVGALERLLFSTDSGIETTSQWAALLGAVLEHQALYQAAQQEIAERRRAEAQLRAHQEQLEELVQARTAALQQLTAELRQHNERLNHGIELARDIQLALLPASPPWSQQRMAVSARSIPAHEVGGDFYLYAAQAEERLAVAIGDVSGKGVGAALLMALTLSTLESQSAAIAAPGELLAALNRQLAARFKASHMNGALLYAVIDLQRRTLRVANAGMIVPILLRDGALQFIEAYGLPLGSLAQARYAETCIDLEAGDRLILVSDGIVEAHNQWGDLFGFERLEQALRQAPADPAALVQAVIDEVLAFAGPQAPHDDMTILALAPQLPR